VLSDKDKKAFYDQHGEENLKASMNGSPDGKPQVRFRGHPCDRCPNNCSLARRSFSRTRPDVRRLTLYCAVQQAPPPSGFGGYGTEGFGPNVRFR
jgi:hypothetical protein